MSTYVLSAKRTPVGSFQGSLAKKTAPELGAHAISAALSNSGLDPSSVNEVLMGNVVSAGLRQAPARQAMRQAQLPDEVPATTVNKVCGSGMKATMLGFDQIELGNANVVVSGGMESMTNAPYILPKARAGLRMGHAEFHDTMFTDGLEDAETGKSMGSFAQDTADRHQLTREAMDEFAINSVKKALAAMENGSLQTEIEPFEELSEDEQPRKSKVDRIPTLRPAFARDGTITAANASSISDGASALVLANEQVVEANGEEPLARIVAYATNAIHPSKFTIAPVGAIQKLFEKTGWDRDSVDLFEINEAFAMVTMLATSELGLNPEKVNIYGGACAQGHPIGSTGARLIVTLAHALKRHNKKRGIAALCIGGGESTAIAIERP
ncbi:MAG: thiolase family protein [Gammaproteobacteria bacterium]|nr:thiolase family protein [Gammaproteobacteria bacterium]